MNSSILTGKFSVAKSYHELTKRQMIGTIIGLQLTLLLAALEQTVVSTAMPKVIASLNGFDRYAWVTTAYMLTSTCAVPIFGKLSDLYGRKTILVSSILLFLVTSSLCGFSGEIPGLAGLGGMNQLILFRGLQGLAGGTLMAMCFTVIGDIFPPAERGKYQGLFSAVFAFASVTGPMLGGWITDCLNWRWVFFLNVPVGAVALAVIWFAFPYIAPQAKKNAPVDWLGAVTLIAWLVPLLLALTWAVSLGWTAPPILALLLAACVFLAVFLKVESTRIEPMVPLSLFKIRMFALSSVSLLTVGMAMFGSILFIPLFMQAVLGVSASQSGSLLTPLMLMVTVGSVTSGQITSRTGKYKVVAVSGLGLMTVGLCLLSTMSQHSSHFDMVRNMIIVGLGLGSLMPVYTLIMQNESPPEMMGSATASSQFFRSMGGTLGSAIFGSLMMSRYLYELKKELPANTPATVLKAFENPLKMQVSHAQLAATHNLSLQPYIELVKQCLVNSIGMVFVVAAVLVALTFALNFFIKESPLRRFHQSANNKVEALPEPV